MNYLLLLRRAVAHAPALGRPVTGTTALIAAAVIVLILFTVPYLIYRRKKPAMSEARYRAMISNIAEVIVILDAGGVIQYVSPNVEKLFGRKPEELAGTSCWEGAHPDDIHRLREEFERLGEKQGSTASIAYRLSRKSGGYRCIEATAANMLGDPDIQGILVTFRDVTEKKSQEERIRYISYHDSLTGLFNRTFFERELERLDAGPLPYSVVVGDIDGLRLTNEVFGMADGDKVLVRMAEIVKGCSGEEGISARISGDSFCLLLPGADEAAAHEAYARIRGACDVCEIPTDGGSFRPSMSLGYATKTRPEQTAEKTLAEANDFMMKRKLLEHKSMHSSLVASIRATMSEKSHETREHADRLVARSRAIGRQLSLSDGQLYELELLAELHDIGKISVDEQILTSPAALTDTEWVQMKRHPEVGYRIALASPELKPVAEGILSHHERWDGKGYPQKLKGEDIPLLARILAVVDAYDAMTNDRAYRKALPEEQALREIERNSGVQFDPEVVKVFMELTKD